MANRWNGTGSLNYMGVNAPQPPNLITMDRRPTATDGVGFALGTLWLIPQQATGIKPNKEVWVLVGNRQNVFTWKHLRGSTGPTPIPFAINTIVYDTAGSYTYTPIDGMLQVTVQCVGGGGGAYGTNQAVGIGQYFLATGGGGGSYCQETFTASEIGTSQSVVVGSGGAGGAAGGVSGNPGVNGGNSTFGSFMTAGGGLASTSNTNGAPSTWGVGGTATGGDVNIPGQGALVLQVNPSTSPAAGSGGNSAMGFGFGGRSPALTSENGQNATGYGGGGGGGFAIQGESVTQATGGDGTGGLVIITEYV